MKLIPYDILFLRGLLRYNPDSGELRWARAPGIRTHAKGGDLVKGYKNHKGYHYLVFENRTYPAHRVIWKWMTGSEPPEGFVIDHRNRNTLDNRWINLRLASPSQNNWNADWGPRRNVSWCKRSLKWRVTLRAHGKKIEIGRFTKEEDAVRAAAEARKHYHGEFACDHVPEGGWPAGME